MFCPNCGAQANGKFCPNCGTPLNVQQAAPVRSAPDPNYGYQQPNAGYAQPNVGYVQTNVGYAQPNPGYAQPNPGYAQPNPGYAQPNPGYVQPNNGYVYAQPAPTVNVNVNTRSNAPVAQLRTNRSLLKTILLSIITLGIYALVVMCHVSTDINTIATRYDNKRTMHFALLTFIIAPITLGIGAIVWEHKLCNRMRDELLRRGINYAFSASDFWLWGVLGSLIIVGPFVFGHKFFKAMNMLCADFNVNG